MRERQFIQPGQRVRLEMPYSEVCMHMRVAGLIMDATLIPTSNGWAIAQLYTVNGHAFSAPITIGEAGFYWDAETRQFYCYPAETAVAA